MYSDFIRPIVGRRACIGKKGSFYIAQYPVRWTAQSTLHYLFAFPGRPVHSDTNSASPGSIGMHLIEYHDNDALNKPETSKVPVYSVNNAPIAITKESLITRFPISQICSKTELDCSLANITSTSM